MEKGYMTKGLCALSDLETKVALNTDELLNKIQETLEELMTQ